MFGGLVLHIAVLATLNGAVRNSKYGICCLWASATMFMTVCSLENTKDCMCHVGAISKLKYILSFQS